MKRSTTTQTAFTPGGGFNAEQVIATLPTPSLSDNPLVSSIVIDAVLNYTIGATGTGQSFRVRRGSLTGTQVGPTFAPAVSPIGFPICVVDSVPNPPPAQYVITVQQAAATANGTVNYLAASATAS